MSTANVSTAAEEVLRSFDLLPEQEKHLIACEILRKVFPSTPELNDAQLATLYAEFADADRKLAEEGIEEYEKGLVSEENVNGTAEELLRSFDLLPEPEKHKAATEILRRSLEVRSAPLTDEELALNAEQVFIEFDRRESEDGQSQSG